jgi:hypothetical protein
LVAICTPCQKTIPTASMIGLAGRENDQVKHFPVCLSCANEGCRPPEFSGVYQPRYE